MTSFTRIFSSIKSAYNNINPSTLTGAIDIIVVKQEDGTLRCTPFHVRFGKLGVLQNQQNKVYITINGNSVEDLYMQLGEAGEAVFIEEDTTTPCLPPTRHLEPSDSNIFLDPDNALLTNSHPQLSNIDCSPQIINKQLDEQKSHENNEPTAKYAYEQPSIPSVEIDVLNSNTIVPNRRRTKRRNRNEKMNKQSSEEEDQEIEKIFSSTKRRSRGRPRDLTPTSLNDNPTCPSRDEQINSSGILSRRRSASENDLSFFPIDDENQSESSTPFVDAHSRINSIDSRKKLLIIPPKISVETEEEDDNDDNNYSSSPEDSIHNEEIHEKSIRTLSNPIPIEQKIPKNDLLQINGESNTLIDAIFSQSAPITNNTNTIPVRISQSNDRNSYYLNENFSPTSSFESPISLRPTSPKSDTEYELDKSSQQSTINNRTSLGWQWKWGELPEQRRSVFRYLWPSSSSKQNTPKEGIYLDDITNNKCNDRSRYLPEMDYHQNQQKNLHDDDQESGTGNSIPHSPVREHEVSCLLGDIQLSLCGNLNKQSSITDDIFNAHLISYETFATNPSIINDPNLIARIHGKFYNWNIASALIASTSVYHKQLPSEIVEQLQEKNMTQTKSRTTGGSSWWPFSGKKSDITNENAKLAATDALALAVKSEVIPTILKDQNYLRHNSNDSEQEDNEVSKLTDKIKSKQQLLKKTMILTSDQLKRLNLKSGMNQVEFSVTTALQGTTIVEANIFFFDHMTKFVISDIDGTITKSDVFGHILPLVGKDWSHEGIAEFFQAIKENGYQFIYLSARAIGQSRVTRNFLRNIKQCGCLLPNGPLFISPDTLVTALYREVIAKKPEDFKIECLKNIASLFPDKNPFYAGFGNRINDQWAYTAVGIPVTRIFTINPRGEVVRQKISQVLSTSYKNLHEVVDQVFPPMDSFSASESYSSFTFWRNEPIIDSLEDEMCRHLEEMFKRQKTKGKRATTPTTGVLSKTTPTTTVIKPGGEKLLTLAQATENTMKPSRLARRFNKKGRQEKKVVIIEQNSSKNVIIEGETTTADNNSILPSKKRTTRSISQTTTSIKRKLSKKERKRLEKVLDVKKKKAKRIELLDKLGQVQIDNDELALLHSVKNIGSKVKRQPITNISSSSSSTINLKQFSRKRPAQISNEIIQNESESSSSDNDDDDETINDEDIRKALLPSQTTTTTSIPPSIIKRRQRQSSTSSTEETKIDIPARPHANVQVERSEEIQAIRSQLPIITEEQIIMEAIHDNLVVLICGETGSGKTTQVPQFLYEAGYTLDGKMIGITEPRRVAAISMASRVAYELNLTNDQISYQIRYEGTYKKETTCIKFMTDGVLLKEVQNDFLLTKYSCILIDEAHERSVATDVLIGLLSRIVPIRCRRNDPLRLIIMSATMRIEEFINNKYLFKLKPKIINIDARQYPVTIHFNKHTPINYIEEAYKKVCKIHRQLPEGGILVFVTGQQEVQTLCNRLRKKFPIQTQVENNDEPHFKSKKSKKKKQLIIDDKTPLGIIDDEELEHLQSDVEEEEEGEKEGSIISDLDDEDIGIQGISIEPLYVLPLYAILSSEKQSRVFEPPPSGTRLCIVATNVAETSITISNVKYIVDCGKVKTKYYDKLTGVSTFRIEWTSKASANQRTGRAGRTAPGHCYRLYSSAVYNDSFSEYTSPEIVRKPVEDLVLQLKTLNIDRLANFPFPTPPDLNAINIAEQILVQLNALDSQSSTKKITELGRRMSAFPINPRYSKMIVIAQENQGLLPYVIALVAALSVNEVLISGQVKIEKDNQEINMNLDDLRRQWIGQGESLLFGDMMILLKAVGALDHQNSKNDLSICTHYGLRSKAMTEICKIRRQLIKIVKTILPETASILDIRLLPPNEQQICLLRKILAAGMVDRLAKRIEGSVIINGHKVNNAYQTLLLEEPVFIHPSSVLINDLPSFVCYQELHETNRIFIKDICAIEMDWIIQLNPHLCSFGPIEDNPLPRYDENQDKMVCHRKASIGQRVSWSLGKSIETLFPNDTIDRYRWFGKYFLDGIICPRLLQFHPALLCSSNAMVKSWASLMERTQTFLNALITKQIDSRTQLTEIWSIQPKYLLDVYCNWLPESLHAQVRSIWPPIPFVLTK